MIEPTAQPTRHSQQKIRTLSFKHQWFYTYRLHYDRLPHVPFKLRTFLENLFDSCPDHLFVASEFRCSKCRMPLPLTLQRRPGHEIISLAKQSAEYTELKSRHGNLQKYFLLNDPRSLAAEVPVWLEPAEMAGYETFFGSRECLTGHIDLLRVCLDGNGSRTVEIWDYKPGAAKEKHAVTQVFLYAFILAFRAGLPVSQFSCGYFDETDAFTFEPEKALGEKAGAAFDGTVFRGEEITNG